MDTELLLLLGVAGVVAAAAMSAGPAIESGRAWGEEAIRKAVSAKTDELYEQYIPFMIRHPQQHLQNQLNSAAQLLWNTPEYLLQWIGTFDD